MKFYIGAAKWPGISKLVEECGEVVQVAGKILGTNGNPYHWDGSDLEERLEEELADLKAAILFIEEHNHLDVEKIHARTVEKYATFVRWHAETQKLGREGLK